MAQLPRRLFYTDPIVDYHPPSPTSTQPSGQKTSPMDAPLQVQPPTECSRPPPRTDQPVKRVSNSAKIAYMPTPITPTTISAAKTSGTLKLELAISITLPMPLLPAMISAMTVPTNDKVIAIFSEAKK